ncbi:MAG: fibronectin type III domain-containing protein [Deltaproteobacteria bacterium]|nr:fibronectin type III domain-containing protein [Deltaproteobacteria bacterium]
MFRSSKKTFFLLLLFTLHSSLFSPLAQARQNWFDSLKDFFKQQIGSVDFNIKPNSTQNLNPVQNTSFDPRIRLNPNVIFDPSLLRDGPTPMEPFRLNPATAYDPVHQRYLVVWEQKPALDSSEIHAQYYSREGVAQGTDLLVSTARPTQGCLYSGFHSDRPNLTPLSEDNCKEARNPSVAYSNGKFLILWELGGTAPYAYNAHYITEMRDGHSVLVRTDEAPTVNEEGKVFSNIIAKMVNADDSLSPANPMGHDNNWDEGILISQFNVSVNQDYVYNATTRHWDAFNPATATDMDVQAWWVSKNPKVAALTHAGASDPTGFVVTWDSNREFTDCREPIRRASTGVFARYIDENFLGQIPRGSANPNKPVIPISRDVSGDPTTTPDHRCSGDVQEAKKPKLAVAASNDVVLTYESTTASFPNATGTPTRTPTRIGLKKLSFSNIQGMSHENSSSDFGIIFPSTGTENQQNPDLLTYRNQVVLAYDDASSIYLQKFNTSPALSATCPMGMPTCSPVRLGMEGDAAKTKPVLGSNLNGSACPMAPAGMETACRPDTLGLSYLEADNVKLAFLDADSNFSPARPPVTLSSGSTTNVPGALASNGVDFFGAWTGVAAHRTNIFTSASPTLAALVAPTLVTPNVDANLPSTTVDFSWSHPGGTGIQYTLQLAPMGSTLADVASCQNVSTTMCRVSTGLSFGQSYQWRVKAVDSRYRGREIFSTETRTFRLSVDALPAPVLISPAADASLTSNSVDFSWSHPGGAGIQYTLQLGQGGMPATDVPTCQNITALTCRVSGLTFGQSYQWRVTARDSTMPLRTSVSAETRSFNLAVEVLAPPVLISPVTTPVGSPLTSNAMDFSWTHPGGAGIQYTLQLSPTGMDLVDVPTCQNITALTCHVSGLMWGQTYQWRVTARDSTMPLRTSVSAEMRTFTLIGILAAPMLVSPDNAATLSTNSVTLQWAAMTPRPGLVYDVFVDDITTSGSSTPFARQTGLSGNSAAITGLLGSHDYRWWVVARDSTAMRIESDMRRDFHVNDLNPPSAPGLAAQPANGVTWAPTRLYLSWTASTDIDPGDSITGYDVYFVEGTTVPSDACPYKRVSTSTTNFIIQASTDGRATYVPDMTAPAGLTCSMTSGGTRPIYLQAPDTGMTSRAYAWKICSVNNHNLRSCSEVRQFNTDDSVVGWWRFDESPTGPVCPAGLGGVTALGGDVGETVCDYSGKGNHGVPHGSPVWLPPVTGGMAGVLGGALQFDGVDDKVTVDNSTQLNPISFSIQSNTRVILPTMGEEGVIDKRFGGYGYNLRFSGSSFPMQVEFRIKSDGPSEDAEISGGIIRSELYTLIGTYNHVTRTISLYKNNSLTGNHIVDAPFVRTSPSTGPIVIGERSFTGTSPSSFTGSIDEVLLYSKSLIGSEAINNLESVNLP